MRGVEVVQLGTEPKGDMARQRATLRVGMTGQSQGRNDMVAVVVLADECQVTGLEAHWTVQIQLGGMMCLPSREREREKENELWGLALGS